MVSVSSSADWCLLRTENSLHLNDQEKPYKTKTWRGNETNLPKSKQIELTQMDVVLFIRS